MNDDPVMDAIMHAWSRQLRRFLEDPAAVGNDDGAPAPDAFDDCRDGTSRSSSPGA